MPDRIHSSGVSHDSNIARESHKDAVGVGMCSNAKMVTLWILKLSHAYIWKWKNMLSTDGNFGTVTLILKLKLR